MYTLLLSGAPLFFGGCLFIQDFFHKTDTFTFPFCDQKSYFQNYNLNVKYIYQFLLLSQFPRRCLHCSLRCSLAFQYLLVDIQFTPASSNCFVQNWIATKCSFSNYDIPSDYGLLLYYYEILLFSTFRHIICLIDYVSNLKECLIHGQLNFYGLRCFSSHQYPHSIERSFSSFMVYEWFPMLRLKKLYYLVRRC